MKAFNKIVVGTISAVLMLAVCVGSDTQARPKPIIIIRPLVPGVQPIRLRLPCGSIDCRVPVRVVVCERPTCAIRANLFVKPRSTRLKAQPLALFASSVTNVPLGTVVDIRPRLTKLGKAIVRSGRTVKGRLVITDAITGSVFNSQPVDLVPR